MTQDYCCCFFKGASQKPQQFSKRFYLCLLYTSGLKQLDEVGPSGETVMDYSVFDAMRAGFERVVFVIRRDIEEAFKSVIGKRYSDKIEVEYAFQDSSDLPAGFTVPEGRTKPWGTGHAVYAARKLLTGPFAVINADDFYGRDSYRKLAEYLRGVSAADGKIKGCIASFVLANTLSENGSVSRGICSVDAAGIWRRSSKIRKSSAAMTAASSVCRRMVSRRF